MSGVTELVVVLGVVGAAVWLPGAVVIKLAALLRPRRDEAEAPAGGPAMDL